jgi:TolB-like protein/DNA-binding winged helix-turn-helix (wHTH) protein
MAAGQGDPMDSPTSSGRKVRAGLFEIDLAAGELHKNGRRLPLQEQPFRVLATLLEHPGDVVTRQELKERLWPADTYVGFDEGLNTAIRKLRTAFGDSAGNPRFIETLPRRGYRFIAPVTETMPADGFPSSMEVRGGGAQIEGHAAAVASGRPQQVERPPTAADHRGRGKRVVLVTAFLVLVLTVAAYVMHRHSSPGYAPAKRAMLAVLPFQNLSNGPGQEYFSDGLTEETITDLGQLSPENLGVIARTSAMAYKHTGKTVSQIGRELRVDYVLEGSVRREGGKARVSVQLIRVSDQTHLWAQNYDRDLQDLLDVQNELGGAIAEQVRANLTPRRQIELAKKRMVNPGAYDLYLKGRFYWNQRTPDSIKESIGYFQQATAKDGNFALAYAGLADAYNISNIVGPVSARDSFPQAKAAAVRAILLDPSLAEAHAALGMEKSHYEFDFPGAEREFLKAIDLNPNSPNAIFFIPTASSCPWAERRKPLLKTRGRWKSIPFRYPSTTLWV